MIRLALKKICFICVEYADDAIYMPPTSTTDGNMKNRRRS